MAGFGVDDTHYLDGVLERLGWTTKTPCMWPTSRNKKCRSLNCINASFTPVAIERALTAIRSAAAPNDIVARILQAIDIARCEVHCRRSTADWTIFRWWLYTLKGVTESVQHAIPRYSQHHYEQLDKILQNSRFTETCLPIIAKLCSESGAFEDWALVDKKCHQVLDVKPTLPMILPCLAGSRSPTNDAAASYSDGATSPGTTTAGEDTAMIVPGPVQAPTARWAEVEGRLETGIGLHKTCIDGGRRTSSGNSDIDDFFDLEGYLRAN
ncbi:hypothetical protein AC578_7771 [Pseudocercospora eumusae]|uniref:Uncharacterized protein n=1 Tax=Pseudocercospora eumusae TaxID=321146 RepID=A0A139H0X1_9PEZI|nr:hypothetical protein AC578_7771 [Pseudocercospora eumusae]